MVWRGVRALSEGSLWQQGPREPQGPSSTPWLPWGPALSSLPAPSGSRHSHLPLPCFLLCPEQRPQIPAQILRQACTRGETPPPWP